MSNEIKKDPNVDSTKREFIGKFGKYAAAGAGMAILMTPTASTAGNYGKKRRKGNNGWGNGNQRAPGNSRKHNNAENGGRTHRKHGNSIPD